MQHVPPSLLGLVVLAGCVSYQPDPIDPLSVLDALRRVELQDAVPDPPEDAPFDASDGLTLAEARAVALALNPSLAAHRATLPLAEAQRDEAGRLADVTIGWEAGNNVADFLTDRKSSANSYLAGFAVTWPLPRPGELDAEEGLADADLDRARADLHLATWTLTRAVHEAYVERVIAERRVAQTERLAEIAARSLDYFTRARRLNATTALDENLARVAAHTTRADLLRARADAQHTRLHLNDLLGLPPETDWTPQTEVSEVLPEAPHADDADDLVAFALPRRPDLHAALADHQRAEDRLRLEVARQWPQLSIGTGLAITLPIFRAFNRPAIETATRARAVAARRVEAVVQQVRAEVVAARAEWERAQELRALFRDEVEPELERSLELTEQAFRAREFTPLQILTAQQQVVEIRTRALEVERRWALARVRFEAALGASLPEPSSEEGSP